MDETQLQIAQKDWGYSMEIELIRGKIFVANEGWISDNPADFKVGKHFGEYAGFYYYFRRNGTKNMITNVIRTIIEGSELPSQMAVAA
jgi:hypothetical protein